MVMAEANSGHNVLDYEWHCPSCTFINKPGSFKCHMCKTPKGTATRQVKSSVSALEMQYATETAIKAHNSRLKAAAAAANQLLISSLSTTITTVALSTGFATTSSCTTASSSVGTPNHSNGNSGLVSQKRRQKSRNHSFYSGTESPIHSSCSSKVLQKIPCTGCDWAKDMNRHMRAAAQSSVYRCRVKDYKSKQKSEKIM